MNSETFKSPAESTEAEVQKGRLEKAQKEAEYYRTFLNSLRKKVMDSLERGFVGKGEELLGNLNDRTVADLNELKNIEEAKKEAEEKTGIKPEKEFVNLEILGKMTPKEFIEYLDKLESELVK
jgi:hypothetical protein